MHLSSRQLQVLCTTYHCLPSSGKKYFVYREGCERLTISMQSCAPLGPGKFPVVVLVYIIIFGEFNDREKKYVVKIIYFWYPVNIITILGGK